MISRLQKPDYQLSIDYALWIGIPGHATECEKTGYSNEYKITFYSDITGLFDNHNDHSYPIMRESVYIYAPSLRYAPAYAQNAIENGTVTAQTDFISWDSYEEIIAYE